MLTVSVIIPSYNCARFLPETLNSILSQDYPRLQIIVVDDGSTDDTRRVMERYVSPDLVYLRQENSGGCSAPRNVAIAHASGDLIALFDADDVMRPNKISRTVQFFEREPGLGLVFSNLNLMQEDGRVLDETFLNEESRTFHLLAKHKLGDGMYVIPKEEAFRGLFFHNYIVPSGATLPRSVLTTLGGFDVRLKNSEDRDMWFRVARDYPIGYLDEIGFTRRLRASSMMAAPAARLVPSKLLALRKQLAAGLPTDLARQAKRLIAGNLYSVGHEHQNQGNLREARRFFIQSNREQANLPALRGLALTVLGSRLGRLAKQFIGRD